MADMDRLLKEQDELSPRGRNAADILRSRPAAGASGIGNGFAGAGRMLASKLGVDACTRHLYNNSGNYFAVSLRNAGRCSEPDGKSPQNGVCLIPPHTTGTLNYKNMGNLGAKVLIAADLDWDGNGHIRRSYNLNGVGCRILDQGSDGPVAVNNPAEGDISTCGKSGWRCNGTD